MSACCIFTFTFMLAVSELLVFLPYLAPDHLAAGLCHRHAELHALYAFVTLRRRAVLQREGGIPVRTQRVNNLDVEIKVRLLHLEKGKGHKRQQRYADALCVLSSHVLCLVGEVERAQLPRLARLPVV